MKLLIITQVVDKNDPILGFFHRWIEEFANQCEQVHVIGLQVGIHTLPKNVTVHSLGKETGKGRLIYLWRFYSMSWRLRREYDGVFVHMNQIYILLGWLLWRLLRKKIGLWYAHGAVSLSLKMAVHFTDFVFTSTKQGLRIDTKKRVIVGQGIDTTVFTHAIKEKSSTLRLITVGRVSQSKNIDTLLQACSLLKSEGIKFIFTIVGAGTTPEEVVYAGKMRNLTQELDLEKEVVWYGTVANVNLSKLLQNNDIFIHDGATNSLDKTLIEASLCGCVVISSNPAYKAETFSLAPEFLYESRDVEALAKSIQNHAIFAEEKVESVRSYFKKSYRVEYLISAILDRY